MKRSTPVFICTMVCMTVFLSGSCTLFTSTEQTKYKIVDKSSGRLRAAYTLDEGARRPSRIDSYSTSQKLLKSYALEYGTDGRLTRKVTTTETVSAPLVSEASYTYVDTYTASGQLESTTQTSSDGTVVATYFGYDDTGTVRGVAEKVGSALLAKDYAQ